MDSLLGGLFGDQGNADDQRAKAEDFVNRVETGDPTEGFSDAEAIEGYSAVASRLSPQELEDAATQALERFSPEQRREFAQMLERQSGEGANVDPEDPRQVAQLTSQLQSQSPDGLVGLLGGGSLNDILGGLLGGSGSSSGGGGGLSDLVGGLLGGGDDKDTAGRGSGASSSQTGGLNDLLSNPIAKAVLAAIAAMAMKKFAGGGGGLGDLIGGGDDAPERRASEAPRRSGGLEGGQAKKA